MTRITTLLSGTLLAAGLTVGLSAVQPTFAQAHEGQHAEPAEGKTVTVTGELIDTACFVSSDGGAKGAGHAACATKCLASGIPAAVLPEGSDGGADAALFLLTNPKPLAQYAAKTIKVEGIEHGAAHAIDVKKLSVKQDDGTFKEIQLDDAHHGADAEK